MRELPAVRWQHGKADVNGLLRATGKGSSLSMGDGDRLR
jgi:hypothetical protein